MTYAKVEKLKHEFFGWVDATNIALDRNFNKKAVEVGYLRMIHAYDEFQACCFEQKFMESSTIKDIHAAEQIVSEMRFRCKIK